MFIGSQYQTTTIMAIKIQKDIIIYKIILVNIWFTKITNLHILLLHKHGLSF